MGILTLLRNAFGRSRKGRAAEAEGADLTPSHTPEPTVPAPSPEPQPTPSAQVPEPRSSSPEDQDEHDLVSAAFDNVTVPRPSEPLDTAPTEPPLTKPEARPEPATTEAPTEPKPTTEVAPEPEPAAETEPIIIATAIARQNGIERMGEPPRAVLPGPRPGRAIA